MSNRITAFIIVLLSSILLTCCSSPDIVVTNKMRLVAVHEAGVTYGAQNGLVWASSHINRILEQHAIKLDTTFNFHAILLKNNLLPPIVSEGGSSLNMNDGQAIRFADRTYKIEKEARFVSAPPTWRNYLYLNYTHVAQPDTTLLPRDSLEEKVLWTQGVRQGWHQGIAQAQELFQINLARLQHDYVGMHLYRVLLKKNMISEPYIAKVKLGITGNLKKMRVNDQVMRITSKSNLTLDSKKWRPILIKP